MGQRWTGWSHKHHK